MWLGSVVDGKTVCAANVYEPRWARARMLGVFASVSASGRRPSIEMRATRGGGGGGVGVAKGVGSADGWLRLLPQALVSAASTSKPLAIHHREWLPPFGSAILASPPARWILES